MAVTGKAAKAGAGAYAAGRAARNNMYVQRLVDDEDLRENLRTERDGQALRLLSGGGAEPEIDEYRYRLVL